MMAAMANTMVYADPRNDVTNDVVYNLNRMYKAAGGSSAKTPASTPAAGTAAPAAGGPTATPGTGAPAPDGGN